MILPRNSALLGLFGLLYLLNFAEILSSSSSQIHSQVYLKMRASSRFKLGVMIAQIFSRSPSACAIFCQLRGCQSFEFGCDDDPVTGPCSYNCRIYRNVAPKLEDQYFLSSAACDYYEIWFSLPPQEYPQCSSDQRCRPGLFCGKVVKRAHSPDQDYHTLTVRSVCYAVLLNTSDSLNWIESKDACNRTGGKLVAPADRDEHKLVVSLVNRMTDHPNYLQAGHAPPTVWLGCSGWNKDWKWLNGSVVTNAFWLVGSPGNTGYRCCATLYAKAADTALWIDRDCTDSTARVCVYERAA